MTMKMRYPTQKMFLLLLVQPRDNHTVYKSALIRVYRLGTHIPIPIPNTITYPEPSQILHSNTCRDWLHRFALTHFNHYILPGTVFQHWFPKKDSVSYQRGILCMPWSWHLPEPPRRAMEIVRPVMIPALAKVVQGYRCWYPEKRDDLIRINCLTCNDWASKMEWDGMANDKMSYRSCVHVIDDRQILQPNNTPCITISSCYSPYTVFSTSNYLDWITVYAQTWS